MTVPQARTPWTQAPAGHEPAVPALPGLLARGWRGLVWYLRAVTGEDRWDAHVRECAAHGHPAGTRREFERQRQDRAEGAAVDRCC